MLLSVLSDRIINMNIKLPGGFMAFVSQVDKSRAASSRIGDSSIVVTQSYKASTKAQELSIRLTSLVLSKGG